MKIKELPVTVTFFRTRGTWEGVTKMWVLNER